MRFSRYASSSANWFGKSSGAGCRAIALQGERRGVIGAGRASDSQVDAIRKERAQNAECFGDLQGAVMRQHHPAAADTNSARVSRDRPNKRFRTRASKHGSAVMLSHPIAGVAQFIREVRQVERVAKRISSRESFRDWRLIENAEAEQSLW